MNTLNDLPPELRALSLNQELLVSIRTKLVQLIDSTRYTSSLIESGGSQALLPWPEIVSRYTLLLAHTRSISNQLSPAPYFRQGLNEKESARAWAKTLAQSVIVPVRPIEQEKEFIVGVLLRTRQDLEIENESNNLMNELPPHLRSFPITLPNSEIVNDPTLVQARLQTVKSLIEEHDGICRTAAARAQALKLGTADDDDAMDEDEDLPQYVWNMRLEEEAVKAQGKEGLTDFVTFLRDGRRLGVLKQ